MLGYKVRWSSARGTLVQKENYQQGENGGNIDFSSHSH